MPRCCQGGTCACLLMVGDRLSVTGVGSAQDPYLIGLDLDLEVVDSTVFNLSLSGAGTTASPWLLALAFASTAKLDDLPDVNASAPTNAQVLGWDSATSTWTPRAPTTAASGSVQHDTSMSGDGSGGTPLVINEDPNGYLVTAATGLGFSDAAKTLINRRYGTSALRALDPITPQLNSVTMLDTAPGQMDYWTGSQWLPVHNGVKRTFGTEFLALSGPYVAGLPVTLFTKTVTVTTDAVGQFDILTTVDLAGAAGVLTCHVQEAGAVAYKAVAFGNIDHVSGIAYRLDDGTPLTSQNITAIVTGYIY